MNIWIKKLYCACLFTAMSLLTLLHYSCNGNPTSNNSTPTPAVTHTVTMTNTATVTNTATPAGPVINSITNQTASKSGAPIHITLSSTNPQGNTLVYSVNSATGLSVSGNTLTANVSSYTVGNQISVTVTVTDTGTTETSSTSFLITVTA